MQRQARPADALNRRRRPPRPGAGKNRRRTPGGAGAFFSRRAVKRRRASRAPSAAPERAWMVGRREQLDFKTVPQKPRSWGAGSSHLVTRTRPISWQIPSELASGKNLTPVAPGDRGVSSVNYSGFIQISPHRTARFTAAAASWRATNPRTRRTRRSIRWVSR